MINEIYIENFAIIEKTNIEFDPALNILTGETGAGKSIIINALELILGSRANKDYIGNYSDRAIVEASLIIPDGLVESLYKDYSIKLENDIIITREIYKDSNSIARINNRRVKLDIITFIMDQIVNIHGQNENYILNDKNNYINIIDSFDKEKTYAHRSKLKELYGQKKYLNEEIAKLNIDSSELERRMDILSFQIDEIESANLENLDLDSLNKEYVLLNNISSISKALNSLIEYYSSSNYNKEDISGLISKSLNDLSQVSSYDKDLEDLYKRIEAISFEAQDIYDCLVSFLNSTEYDQERIHELDRIFSNYEDLKRKYGHNKEEILAFKDEAIKELDSYRSREKTLEDSYSKIEKIDFEIQEIADDLTEKRRDISHKIEKDILSELKKLNFPHANFEIKLEKKDSINQIGQDEADFLVSFNLGQDIKSLSKVGSGGEVSRFMLALKIVMADHDKVNTLIFDEIDTGISGITAAKVGQALKDLSLKYQIISVTHLSQIAVKADKHILINKYTEDGLTKSMLKSLDKKEKVCEIARLIGGNEITDKTLEAAKEQLEQEK